MEKNLSSWSTHDWTSRRLQLVPGQPLIQQVCHACGRGFVDECSTDERYAVHVSIFKLHRLADEVTSRWLAEQCPAERLKADEADRLTRFLGSSSNFAAGEIANEPGFRLVTKSKNLLAVACAISSIAKPSRQRLPQASRAASETRRHSEF